MIALRCTKHVLDYFGIRPEPEAPPSTTVLGDWYANLVPTVAGNLVVFCSERTLLTVAAPLREVQSRTALVLGLAARVVNLLSMLEIPGAAIERELHEMTEVRMCRTKSRKVLGNLTDLAYLYQGEAERFEPGQPLSLSDAEFRLSRVPQRNLGWNYAADVARALLSDPPHADLTM